MAKETRNDFYPVPIVDQAARPDAITRLIIFIVVLTGAAIVFGVFRERLGDPFLLGMLGVLAMIGVGYLFATAIGLVAAIPAVIGYNYFLNRIRQELEAVQLEKRSFMPELARSVNDDAL